MISFLLSFMVLASLLPSDFSENIWIPESLKKTISTIDWQEKKLQTSLTTDIHIQANCTYPHLFEKSAFIEYVNSTLEHVAKERIHNFFVQNEKEKYDEDFFEYILDYTLLPVYCSEHLISVYGFQYQERACPHGWVLYEGWNFWLNGNAIEKITLSNLFLKNSNYSNFLLNYCENQLQSLNTPLKPQDLDTFLLTQNGLMIIFPSSKIGSWTDGPYSITIPYAHLQMLIDPYGPLKNL